MAMGTITAPRNDFTSNWAEPSNLFSSVCAGDSTAVSSIGVWDLDGWMDHLKHPASLLLFQLLIVFFLNNLLHILFKPLKAPHLVTQILSGMILGFALRKSDKDFANLVFSDESESVFTTLTNWGFLLFMFSVGVKMDSSITITKVDAKALTLGILSVVLPLLTSVPSVMLLARLLQHRRMEPLLFTAITLSVCQLPVISCLLMDLKMLSSELGRLSSSAAAFGYIFGVLMNLGYLYFTVAGFSLRGAGKSAALCASYIAAIVFFLHPAMWWIVKHTPEGKPVNESYTSFIIGLAMLIGIVGDFLGLEGMVGPLIFGLIVPPGPPLGSTLSKRLDTIIFGFFVPMLLTYGGYRANVSLLMNEHRLILGLCGVIFLTFLGRLVAALVCAFSFKMPYKDAIILSFILSAKGVVDISLYISGTDKKVMGEQIYTLTVLLVLATAVVVPFMVNRLYDPSRKYATYQKRNILSSGENNELRILVSVHRQDDAWAAIKLLEASNPTSERSLTVYALHLVDLVGRASSLLINHQLGQKASSTSHYGGSRTQKIIDMFNSYKHQSSKSVDVQSFTAVSPSKFMHDDICLLAFNKAASLIILPFHRKWGNKNKVDSDNNTLRSINCHVLDMAPCSVGILIDRRMVFGPFSATSKKPFNHVAMLFLGGEDDREALAFSRWMAKCPEVQLTIVRFVPFDDLHEDGWERVLDIETLKNAKQESSQLGNVNYTEERVREGADTVSIIRSMVRDFELFIVGRRHRVDSPLTLGLAEWSEFPELGPIGDLLASSDIKSAVSALVVQQQMRK